MRSSGRNTCTSSTRRRKGEQGAGGARTRGLRVGVVVVVVVPAAAEVGGGGGAAGERTSE